MKGEWVHVERRKGGGWGGGRKEERGERRNIPIRIRNCNGYGSWSVSIRIRIGINISIRIHFRSKLIRISNTDILYHHFISVINLKNKKENKKI
jgi:hypothetical protein